jgi:NAD(P)-dependent dehydrogenase (short-subunit alcohol dehydrogenase family)
MARVLVTGSADGLGLMAAVVLIGQGHAVTLHARNESRAASKQKTVSNTSSPSMCSPPTCSPPSSPHQAG